jgi:hypothetical protein
VTYDHWKATNPADEHLGPRALRPTADVVTLKELHEEVFGGDEEEMQATDDPSGIIPVCAGEWRREPDGRWRFWADPSFEDGP